MKTIATTLLIIVFTGLVGYITNLPQEAGVDVPEGKLNSLSFAPFREGQSPFAGIFPSVQELESDLTLMGKKTRTIRTYASAEGNMPALPPLAKKYGLSMLQGAWLSSISEANKVEIAALIKAANTYPDVIKRVIVGNEVLLRGDLNPEQLIGYIREVKRSIKQPVSYADVWSMYMQYPQLIKEVDFVTIHILPYWEDEPIAVEQAAKHIEHIVKQVREEADSLVPGIPILIGESGWPSEGRQRGFATPSVVNAATFVRGLIKTATDNGFDYNIVEAINQSWKSQLEGVVGANWGLYSVNRKEVFPLTGDVYENPAWKTDWITAICLFLVGVGFCWAPLQSLPFLPLLGLLAFSQFLLVVWVNQIEYLWYTSYSQWQRAQSLLLLLLNAVFAIFLLRRIVGMLRMQPASQTLTRNLSWLYGLVCAYAIYKTYGLALNGRYISFPTLATAIPVAGIIGLLLIQFFTQKTGSFRQISLPTLFGSEVIKGVYLQLLGIVMLGMGVWMIAGETRAFFDSRDFIAAYPAFSNRLKMALLFTLGNAQLVGWLLSLCVLALPLLGGHSGKAKHVGNIA